MAREKAERSKIERAERRDGANAPQLVSCPDDPKIGIPMYVAGAKFQRVDFHESLAWGCWPEGSRWLYSRRGDKKQTLWEVRGCAMYEIGTKRVFQPSGPQDRCIG